MVQWQRHVLPFLLRRNVGNVNRPLPVPALVSRLPSIVPPHQHSHIPIQRTTPCFPFLLLHHLQVSSFHSSSSSLSFIFFTTRSVHLSISKQGISTSTRLLANSSEPEPVSSPLALFGAQQDHNHKPLTKPDKVQAVLKGIKQSPKKVNLVAALVRGMLVKDALMQLQLTVKRAAKTVFQVISSARANASHNHGLDPERLIVAEAFVGKGFFKKRLSYHNKGRAGLKLRPECRLTVVVREITPEEEAEIARLRVHNFRKLTKREKRLVPHQIIETNPVWGRKNKSSTENSSAASA